MHWTVSQLGAREHYGIPRALPLQRCEVQLVTDWWGRILRKQGRWHEELADIEVHSMNLESLLRTVKGKIGHSRSNAYEGFIETGEWFSKRTRSILQKQQRSSKGFFFSYDTTFLESGKWAKENGWNTILGQMDPGEVEFSIVKEEEERWSDWVLNPINVPNAYNQRRQDEWATADLVLVNSTWSREALIQQGVDASKIRVVPLAYETTGSFHRASGVRHMAYGTEVVSGAQGVRIASDDPQEPSTSNHTPNFLSNPTPYASRPMPLNNPLRVLFLGQVILRKGIQYLVAAARRLENAPVVFDVVGPLGISEKAVKSASENVVFHGRCERGKAAGFYANADVFILPTISDGFAITQIEAMAHGLPVIATRNCGEVVTDGVDGFLIESRSPEAIADVIQRYLDQPELLKQQSDKALEKSKQFSFERLGERLVEIERELLGSSLVD